MGIFFYLPVLVHRSLHRTPCKPQFHKNDRRQSSLLDFLNYKYYRDNPRICSFVQSICVDGNAGIDYWIQSYCFRHREYRKLV